MNALMKLILICGLIAGLTVPALAAEDDAQSGDDVNSEESNVIKSVGKQVTGQVSGISKDYIGIVYQADKNTEREMGVMIKGVPTLERVKELNEIEMGDTVTVEFSEVTEKDENDQEVMKHVATKIIFVKKAPPPPAETTVLTSEESEQQQ